jgi:hypothetical protein
VLTGSAKWRWGPYWGEMTTGYVLSQHFSRHSRLKECLQMHSLLYFIPHQSHCSLTADTKLIFTDVTLHTDMNNSYFHQNIGYTTSKHVFCNCCTSKWHLYFMSHIHFFVWWNVFENTDEVLSWVSYRVGIISDQ